MQSVLWYVVREARFWLGRVYIVDDWEVRVNVNPYLRSFLDGGSTSILVVNATDDRWCLTDDSATAICIWWCQGSQVQFADGFGSRKRTSENQQVKSQLAAITNTNACMRCAGTGTG